MDRRRLVAKGRRVGLIAVRRLPYVDRVVLKWRRLLPMSDWEHVDAARALAIGS